jgi:hypothetical protein
MEVWFYLKEEPRPRGQHTRRGIKRIYTRAPPKRVRRAFALLTKTYHGSRLTGQVESTSLLIQRNESEQ